jgi:hypothetical protein
MVKKNRERLFIPSWVYGILACVKNLISAEFRAGSLLRWLIKHPHRRGPKEAVTG